MTSTLRSPIPIGPNGGPTVASRTAMVVGNLVRSAALGIKQTLIADGALDDKYWPLRRAKITL